MEKPEKRHKKHKREREKFEAPSIKLKIKSVKPDLDSPEHSADSPMSFSVQNFEEDSQHSSLFEKKKKKKKKKKHKHHKKRKEEDEDSSLQSPPPNKKFMDKQPFQKLLDYLYRTLEKKDAQHFFAYPVTDKIAPGYSSIISNPMDFSTIKTKIENESYNSLREFGDDFKLMCNNAMTYNHPDTVYYKASKKLLQTGLKILAPEKIKLLLPMIPSLRFLTEEQMGQSLFDNADSAEVDSDDETLDFVCLDPTKSVHYVAPHPNDPPDVCGAFTDDLTTEEVLLQARLAAREAAHRLATKKPNAKMGFLRQKPDGSTSLAILTPTTAVLPGTKEMPISLGALSGKLTTGTTHLTTFKEEKKLRLSKPVYYGSFSSFAPTSDSTFANLNNEEAEMVNSTYGEETAVQYSESMIEFAKGCDYAMHMVDEILDTITKGDHRRTVNFVQERKTIEDEEKRKQFEQEKLEKELEMEWESSIGTRLNHTATLLTALQTAQNTRLCQPPLLHPPYAPPPSDTELNLATELTEKLTELAKEVSPGDLVSPEEIRRVMGIDISCNFTPREVNWNFE